MNANLEVASSDLLRDTPLCLRPLDVNSAYRTGDFTRGETRGLLTMSHTEIVLRRIWKRFFPAGLRQEIAGWREIIADGWRYQRAANRDDRWSRIEHRDDRHEAVLTMDYHRIEKGLTLPEPRRPFGLAVRDTMRSSIESRPSIEPAPRYVEYAEDALASLERWNEHGDVDDRIHPALKASSKQLSHEDALEFFHSRNSIRNFDPNRAPTDEELRAGLELAQNTPSVCNRQGYRVHFYRDREQVEAILRIQNGATGFAGSVPCVGVVTARRALFVGPDERNQRWVDGGLFAMTLVWAFHALNVSTCMLNWALPGVSSARLRKVADIPDDEDIVVLIALGHAVEGARTARSEKRALDDLGRIHS